MKTIFGMQFITECLRSLPKSCIDPMKKHLFIHKLCYLAFLLPAFMSCQNETADQQSQVKDSTAFIIGKENLEGYAAENYTKAYTYFWRHGTDSSDLTIRLSEAKEDSSVTVAVSHKKPQNFDGVLDSLKHIFTLAEKDFDPYKLKSIFFEPPVFYPDLNLELSKAYAKNFGNKTILQQKLHEFLKSTVLTEKINLLCKPFNKEVDYFGVEKFHLIDRNHYNAYLSNEVTANYPDFSIHGMGMYIGLKNR